MIQNKEIFICENVINFYNNIYFIVYSKIYGDKGEKIFNSLKKTNIKKEKKKVNVSFSGAVEISRN